MRVAKNEAFVINDILWQGLAKAFGRVVKHFLVAAVEWLIQRDWQDIIQIEEGLCNKCYS